MSQAQYSKNHSAACPLSFLVGQIKNDSDVPEELKKVTRSMARRVRLDTPEASPLIRGMQAVAVKTVVRALGSAHDLRDLVRCLSELTRAMGALGVRAPASVGDWPRSRRVRAVRFIRLLDINPRGAVRQAALLLRDLGVLTTALGTRV